MNKQQFIHLHGLFVKVKEFHEKESGSVETPQYDKMDIGPSSIHRSKSDHKEATLTLSKELAESDVQVPEEIEA